MTPVMPYSNGSVPAISLLPCCWNKLSILQRVLEHVSHSQGVSSQFLQAQREQSVSNAWLCSLPSHPTVKSKAHPPHHHLLYEDWPHPWIIDSEIAQSMWSPPKSKPITLEHSADRLTYPFIQRKCRQFSDKPRLDMEQCRFELSL